MKARMLLGEGKPRVPPEELKRVIEDAGMKVGDRRADIGVVVGGDGRFGRYGRTESIPLLFVGVRAKRATGSKAYLAAAYFDELSEALEDVKAGRYVVKEHRRLEVMKNGRSLGEVFTDLYLQRGAESNCIRYRVKVTGGAEVQEAAIGDGVIVSTAAGATGYYSYLDRIKGEEVDPSAYATLKEDEVGICHVLPTYSERTASETHPLRYSVPWGSTIELTLFRSADARLYGVVDDRRGVKVTMKDRVTVTPGKSSTKVIRLERGSGHP